MGGYIPDYRKLIHILRSSLCGWWKTSADSARKGEVMKYVANAISIGMLDTLEELE